MICRITDEQPSEPELNWDEDEQEEKELIEYNSLAYFKLYETI